MVQDQDCVEPLVASGGSVVTVHPACGGAQGVGLLYCLVVLVHTPVLAAFKQVYLTVCPRKCSVGVAG